MQQEDGPVQQWASQPAQAALVERDTVAEPPEWADIRLWGRWVERHGVTLAALFLIVAEVIWKAQFLSRLYFRQDDFHVLDEALRSSFSWGYLSDVPSGHLSVGGRALIWVLARTSLYNWGLYSAVSLLFVALAGLAMFRVLRTLFGQRPTILVPLVLYVLSPLTLPSLGWWVTGIEALPMQLAIPMALNAHVYYVRTGRARHLAASAFWVLFGLAFFEKALIIPVLLFAITSAFLMGKGSWLAGIKGALRQFWRAWLVYAVLMIGFLGLLAVALKGSAQQPGAPGSAGGALTFSADLIRESFVPGAIGGPWQWFPVPGGSYAFTAAPPALTWLAVAVAAFVAAASIWYQLIAWRAWTIVAGWLAVADLAPVLLGRLDYSVFSASLLALESRYVEDAVPVLMICLGFAFLPLASATGARQARRESASSVQARRTVVAVIVGAVVMGSIWSGQAYESVTTGAPARAYIENARLALKQAPAGTVVMDLPVPNGLELTTFGATAYARVLIGDMAPRESPAQLRWTRAPAGTLDRLMAFGSDGRLHPVYVFGEASKPRLNHEQCWPRKNGQTRVRFAALTPAGTRELRIGYLLYYPHPIVVTVAYGTTQRTLKVLPGLHSAFLPVSGSVHSVVIGGFGKIHMCVGDAEAGVLVAAAGGSTIPPTVP